jgi:hypothetical protein
MKSASILASTMIAIACGCDDPSWPDPVDFEWRGNWVTIEGHDRDAEQACGESLRATDESVRTILDFHGSNTEFRVEYRWFSHSRWADLGLPEGGRARHWRGEITSLELAHDHELAHAVSWAVHGRTCTPVLEEGLAVVLEDARTSGSESSGFEASIEELLQSASLESNADYERAGHFVAFLLEAHGVAGVQGLCTSLNAGVAADLEDWDRATRDVLGRSLDELLADYADYPICTHHQYRARLTDCAGEPDVVVGSTETTEFSFRFACDEPEVIGEAGGTMMRVERILVETPGYYEVEIDDGDVEQKVAVIHEQCAACSEVPLTGRIVDGTPYPAGTHCVWATSPEECGYQALSGMHAFVFFLDEGLDRDVTVRITPRVLVP